MACLQPYNHKRYYPLIDHKQNPTQFLGNSGIYLHICAHLWRETGGKVVQILQK